MIHQEKVTEAAERYLNRQPVPTLLSGRPLYEHQQMIRAFCAGNVAVIEEDAPSPSTREPVAWLRHGEKVPVQNVPFGAMWITDQNDPRGFPVYAEPSALQRIDPLTKEVRSVILGFLMCAEIADCDQVDLDPETIALEKRARLLVVDEQHPDDVAVDWFASAMKEKLAKKRAEGYGGWHDPSQCRVEFLSRKLREHIAKGDPVDVGNFAMMLHQRGSEITKPDGWSERALSDDQVEAIVQLVERCLCIIWAQVGAREQFANELRVLEPPADEEAETCEACGEALEEGDLVYWSADDSGHLHADCCGPERESYVNPDGSPLTDEDPIPSPFPYEPPNKTIERLAVTAEVKNG